MDDNLYPGVKLPSSCKHISYIKTKAIAQLLQLNQADVINNERNQCYIPGCQSADLDRLKTFILMGYPPRKTYYSINYIGIGLYPDKSVLTDDWYTAYVPLNRACFNNDHYYVKKCLLKVIGKSKLWLGKSKELDGARGAELHALETTDSFQDLSFTASNFTQNEDEIQNVFKFPVKSETSVDREGCIFATPSCMYATKQELATPFEFEELEVNLQILIQVKVRPDSYLKSQNSIPLKEAFDSCFPNAEIEWYLNSVDDLVADRILFKIVPRNKVQESPPKTAHDQKERALTKVTMVSPNLALGKQFASDLSFQEIKDLYRLETSADCVFFGENKNLLLKLRPTDKHNKVIYFLKTLAAKNCEWDHDTKLWKVSGVLLYEAVKFAVHLSLRVDNKVLYEAWTWLKKASVKSLPAIFDTTLFTKWLKEYPVSSFQRVIVDLSKESPLVGVLPYNKDLVAMFKERKSSANSYTWDKERMMWRCNSVTELLSDLLSVIPNLREASPEEERLLESKGVFLAALKTDVSKPKRDKEPEKFMFQKRRRKAEPEDDQDIVTKLIVTVAAKDEHLQRLVEKVQSVVRKVKPPRSSISSSGKVIMGGAGTGGIEFVQAPTDFDTWNQVSMCIVPNEEAGRIPVEKYDQNLLASLIGDVFIVREEAIDYLLENFTTWPGPHDSINYTRWSFMINKCEPRCWGGVDFDGRQSLAQTGLFDNEDFYISGTGTDATYVRMLILLGCGNIVSDPKDAEYVVVMDRESQEAQELYMKFGDNDEDLISNTHGARHSTLVTPKYIYDCILEWRLKRPAHCDGHMAF